MIAQRVLQDLKFQTANKRKILATCFSNQHFVNVSVQFKIIIKINIVAINLIRCFDILADRVENCLIFGFLEQTSFKYSP